MMISGPREETIQLDWNKIVGPDARLPPLPLRHRVTMRDQVYSNRLKIHENAVWTPAISLVICDDDTEDYIPFDWPTSSKSSEEDIFTNVGTWAEFAKTLGPDGKPVKSVKKSVDDLEDDFLTLFPEFRTTFHCDKFERKMG